LRSIAFAASDEVRLREALRKLLGSATPSGAVIGDEGLHGLPHPQAGYEYCTLTELVFGLGRSAQRLADSALGDWLERVTFNAAQGARAADGTAIAYLCADTRLEATAHTPDSYSVLTGKHGRYKLSPTHDDIACCCNPNATRLLPHYVSTMWLARADAPGLVALAYGPSELRTVVAGGAVSIRQETAYPFEDEVRLTVEAAVPGRWSLWLRRPAWSSTCVLQGIDGVIEDGWIVIDRLWQGSTSFTLRFDVPVRAEPYPSGEFAVLRGALQFVQEIPHQARKLQVTGRPQWPDVELLPVPILDLARADLGLAMQRTPAVQSNRPWHDPPLRLRSDGIELVPLGCAPLRRAAFRARGVSAPAGT
jgi:DUF1680 family protein